MSNVVDTSRHSRIAVEVNLRKLRHLADLYAFSLATVDSHEEYHRVHDSFRQRWITTYAKVHENEDAQQLLSALQRVSGDLAKMFDARCKERGKQKFDPRKMLGKDLIMWIDAEKPEIFMNKVRSDSAPNESNVYRPNLDPRKLLETLSPRELTNVVGIDPPIVTRKVVNR